MSIKSKTSADGCEDDEWMQNAKQQPVKHDLKWVDQKRFTFKN